MLALLLLTRVVIGDVFPASTLPGVDGRAVDLPPTGQVTVVEVFATWCAPCREALPIVERLRTRFGDRVAFIAVSEDDAGDDTAARVARFAAGLGRIALDGDHALYERLVVRKLPTTYVIDAHGVVRHINNGFGPGFEHRLRGWIEETLRR